MESSWFVGWGWGAGQDTGDLGKRNSCKVMRPDAKLSVRGGGEGMMAAIVNFPLEKLDPSLCHYAQGELSSEPEPISSPQIWAPGSGA